MRRRKPSVKELREREILRLVSFKTDHPTPEDFAEARSLMNSFYRLCGLCEKNLYLANEERTCNLKSTQASEDRQSMWSDRLDKAFKDIYGLRLVYCGYMPSIGVVYEPCGGFSEKITRWFYE